MDNPCACIQGVSQIFKRSFSHRYTYNNKSLFRFSIEILNRNIFVTKRNYPLDSTGKFQFSQCSRNPKPRSLTISLSVSIHKSQYPRKPLQHWSKSDPIRFRHQISVYSPVRHRKRVVTISNGTWPRLRSPPLIFARAPV